MAEDLGVSHGLISKVCNGIQMPGKSLLKALAEHPLVNSDWLYRGGGEPLLPPTAGTLPVSNAILPGLPSTCGSLLTGERLAVSRAWESDSRYWLRLRPKSELLEVASLGLSAGDLLLVETSQDYLERTDLLADRICLVSETHENATTYGFERGGDAGVKILNRSSAKSPHSGPSRRKRRRITIRGEEEPSGEQTLSRPAKVSPEKTTDKAETSVHSTVGVVLYAVREMFWRD